MRWKIIPIIICLIAIVVAAMIFLTPKKEQGRMSAVVNMLYSTPDARVWLGSPKKVYSQAYFMFPSNLAQDVIMGLDVEFWEGKENYIYGFSLAWMSSAFISRDGLLVINSDCKENYGQNYAVIFTNITLQPNTWYKLREETNFGRRRYISFSVEGPNVNKTIDLQDYDICISDESLSGTFPGPSLTFYTGAAKISDSEGGNIVYADDVEAGIEINESYKVVLKDGFELQTELLNFDFNKDGAIDVKDIPLVSDRTNWQEGVWYYEHPTSISAIVNEPVLSGSQAVSHDASFFKPGEERFGR